MDSSLNLNVCLDTVELNIVKSAGACIDARPLGPLHAPQLAVVSASNCKAV